MTYRNDHDAALARIDALESELSRARAGDGATAARAELARLEDEIKRRRIELHETETATWRTWDGIKWPLAIALGATVGVFSALDATRSRPHAASPEPAKLAPAARPVATRLLECVQELDRAIEARTASSSTCIEQIRLASTDPILGVDVHDLLVRWLAAEQEATLAQRDALAPAIHRVIIPSFTR